MSTNHFFVAASNIEGDRVQLNLEQAHQVHNVLRLKPGDAIVVLDDSGTEYDVVLTTVEPCQTLGRVRGERRAQGEPAVQVILFQSLLPREKFEWVLQKGTEVGVSQFVPVQTDRSLLRARMIEEKRLNRWRRILTEAAEQSHRGRVPTLEPAITFHEAISRLKDFCRSIIAAPSEEAAMLRDTLRNVAGSPASIALMIGPEGGFTDEEVARACEKGAVRISLGPRVMRTETAAVVTCALALYELGEMGV